MCRSPDPEFLGLLSPGSRDKIQEDNLKESIRAHCWARHPDTDAYCLLMGNHPGPHKFVQDNPILVEVRRRYGVEIDA